MRHIHHLGYKGKLLSELFPEFRNKMSDHYSELNDAEDLILQTISNEEEQFGKTLTKGIKILDEELKNSNSQKIFSGDIAFKLYDTYGFPVDLTADMLRSSAMQIDMQRFDELMKEQKNRGKENWQGSGASADDEFWFELSNKSVSYTHLTLPTSPMV